MPIYQIFISVFGPSNFWLDINENDLENDGRSREHVTNNNKKRVDNFSFLIFHAPPKPEIIFVMS